MNPADPTTVTVAADFPARQPVTFLNYCGDQRSIIDQGPKGPNDIGELLYPVTAEYDVDNQATRVGFSYIAPTPATE